MSVRNGGEGVDAGLESPGGELTTGSLLAQMRGGGEEGPAVAAGPAPVRRALPLQTIITVLVLVGSAASLWAMRRQGMAAGVTFEKTPDVDYTLEPVAAKPTPAQLRILRDLERSTGTMQIATERLPKNPFVLDAAIGSGGGEDTDFAALEAGRLAELERQRLAREAELQAALAGLELHGVMEGRVPLARISGETVRTGDTVGGFFTVVAIYGRSVDLEAEGQVFTLTVGEPAVAKRESLRGPQGVRR